MTSTPQPETAAALRPILEQQRPTNVADVGAAAAVVPGAAARTPRWLARRGDLAHPSGGRFTRVQAGPAQGGGTDP